MTTAYPDLILDEFKLPENSFVEGLYVDLNSIVHMISKSMFRYGLEREPTQEDLNVQQFYRNLREDQRYEKIYRNVGFYLIYLYRYIKPLKIFMLALDGVAPKAKMDQQRERRYGRTRGETDFWNSVVISPGTPFMDGLDTYLTKTWPEMNGKFFTAGMNIVYSSHREPGEGEHKIFDQMSKDMRGKDRTKQMYGNTTKRATPYQVVVGADSDLIILSLSKSKNIIFMRNKVEFQNVKDQDKNIQTGPYTGREELSMLDYIMTLSDFPDCNISIEQQASRLLNAWQDFFKTGFSYVNITDMRRNIMDDYIAPNDIVDFSFISFFVGNDFLPAIPELASVVATMPFYFEDGDIENRFKDSFEAANLPDNRRKDIRDNKNMARGKQTVNEPSGIRTKRLQTVAQEKVKTFNAKYFWQQFSESEPTWLTKDGKLNFKGGIKGIWNDAEGRYEIFPKVAEAITGTIKRKLVFQDSRTGRWITPLEDVGALKKCLKIYSILMKRIREDRRKALNTGKGNALDLETGNESFIVQKKNRINYPNLFRYLKELHSYISVFMNAEIANYEELVRKGRTPDPLIEMALGKEVTGKKTIPEIVPSGFAGLHNVRAFGIYDSKYADPRLPKQSIDEMCRKWLEGAQWTLVYYSNGFKGVNTEWFYPYRDAPTLLDLLHYLENKIICEVSGFPGINYSCLDDFPPTVDLIKIQDHTLFVYLDNEGKQIGLLKHNSTGQGKYIDMDAIEFYKKAPDKKELGILEEEGKIPIIEISREVIKPKVNKYYPLDEDIFNLVSGENIGIESYASTIQSFFSIMPEVVLKQLLDINFVNLVLGHISDAFPVTYEVITDGFFYENQTEPKIPFLSPTRVRRAIDTILESNPGVFDVQVSRYNQMKKRQVIRHGAVEDIGKVKQIPAGVIEAYRTSVTQATSASSNIQTSTKTNNMTAKSQPFIPQTPRVTLQPVQPKKKALWEASPAIDNSVIAQKVTKYSAAELAEIERFKQGKLNFVPFMLENLPTYIPYTPEKRFNDNTHLGQRKLLMDEILFLTMYGNLGKVYVVYIGAAPGLHIPILTSLFPNYIFHLWDYSEFGIQGTNKMNDRIVIYKKKFTNKIAESYRNDYVNKGQKLLLISDIRSGKEGAALQEFEEDVRKDNKQQLDWVNIINPLASILKFRTPYILDKASYNDPTVVNYPYINGPVWLQPWAAKNSSETRLIVDMRNGLTLKNYDIAEYENRMYYFNIIIRNYAKYNLPFSLKDATGTDRVLGLKENYDGAYEIWIWEQFYLFKFPNSNPEQRINAVIFTMNEVSRFLGKDLLGRDISEGISYKYRAPFKTPF